MKFVKSTLLIPALALGLSAALATPAHAADDRAAVSRVAPEYPEIAKRMKVDGMVTVEATVDAKGKVTDAKATAGPKPLWDAAESAVRRWKFEPGDATSTVEVKLRFLLAMQ